MRNATITLLFILAAFSLHAQETHHGELFELDQQLSPNISHEYTASQYIDLQNGFDSEHPRPNQSKYTELEIDKLGVFPPEAGIIGGPDGTGNGVVGAIGGAVSVSPMGGATYTIPITVPTGIGEIKPNLSVNYNSQSGNGLLGWGWTLGGISAITRVNSTLYHDEFLDGVNFDNDRFALDGQRLMLVNDKEYGSNEAEYRTEIDNMAKIVSFKTENDTTIGPAWFKVWTDEGMIMEYGRTNDSRIGLKQNHDVCLWLLNRVKDRNGNYMDFHYIKAASNYYLSSISYTGNENANIQPCYSVKLEYDANSRIDAETMFIGNNMVKNTKLLKSVIIMWWNDTIAHYDFDYHQPSYNSAYPYYRLKEVSYSCGNVSYNPTTISWVENDYYNIPDTLKRQVIVDNELWTDAFTTKFKFTGDFNGDGFTDIIAIKNEDLIRGNEPKTTYWANIYLNTGPGTVTPTPGVQYPRHGISFTLLDSIQLNENDNWVYVADFNQDGKDDFIIVEREGGLYHTLKIRPYLTYTRLDGKLLFSQACSNFEDDGYAIGAMDSEHLLIGDFLGNGSTDIILQIPYHDYFGGYVKDKFLYITCDDGYFNCRYYDNTTVLPGKVFQAADFNGDGITEIWCDNLPDNAPSSEYANASIMKMTSYHSATQFNTDGVLTSLHKLFLGDFNGDGKADFLTYVPGENGGTGTWQVNYFKESKLLWNQFDITVQMPIDEPGNRNYSMKDRAHDFQFIEVGDFNGDGKSDLAVSEGPYSQNKMHFFFGPLHWLDNINAEFAYTQEFYMDNLDLTSSSNLTICIGNFCGRDNLAMLSHNTYVRLPSMLNRYSVDEISDGMGNKSKLTYDYLSGYEGQNQGFYVWDPNYSDLEHDIYVKSLPMKAVSEIVTYNSIVQTPKVSTKYNYKSALVHRKGRGIIGFHEVKQTFALADKVQKTSTSYYETQVTDEHCAALLQQEIEREYQYPYKTLTKCLYTNSYFENHNNQKVFIPIVTRQEDFNYSLDNNWLLSKTITENTFHADFTNGGKCFYFNSLKITDVNTGITRDENCQLVDNCEFQTSTHTEYENETPNNLESWIIKRPISILTAARRIDDDTISQSLTVFAYRDHNTYLTDTITIYPGADLSNVDGLATYTRFVYDAAGNVTEETLGTVDGKLDERPKYYEYDQFRFRESVENILGYKSQSIYDHKYGDLTKTIDENGLENTYSKEDALGTTIWTEYANLTKSCSATRWARINGCWVEDAPENASYFVWEKSTGQNPSKIFFDAANRKLRTVNYGLNNDVIYQDVEYNSDGMIAKESLPYFNGDQRVWTEYSYDRYHRVDTTRYPNGTYATIEYDDYLTRTTLFPKQGSQLRPQVNQSELNALGEKIYNVDPSNTKVEYSYYPNGKLKSSQIENHDNSCITLKYDAAGNRIRLIDPNYGIIKSTYNAYRELTSTISPKSDTTFYSYDVLGRPDTCVEIGHSDETLALTIWKYFESDHKLGLLKEVERTDDDGINKIQYSYDDLLRVNNVTETVDGRNYLTTNTYDELSRISSITYPSGISVKYKYRNGFLHSIKNDSDLVLWKTEVTNALGQINQSRLGNGAVISHDYDPETGKLISQLGSVSNVIIQNYEYQYDDFGNLKFRKENKFDNIESFEYDQLNRLTYIELNHHTISNIEYDRYGMGRMTHKEADGHVVFTSAQYSDAVGDKPHAIQSAITNNGPFTTERQNVTYTLFDQPRQISQNDLELTYAYGIDHQRCTMDLKQDGNLIATKKYIGNCEFSWSHEGGEKVLTYLNGPNGIFAVVVTENGENTTHYVLKDHLGSWTTITDAEGNIEQELSFDPWGNLRNPETWIGEASEVPMFDRGFTGHEHLYEFGLINMNGRMYDPVMSSFLSVDNYIQCPDNSQNFNRYAYCLYNPLRYTDPSGEAFGVDDAALIMAGCILVNNVLYNGISNVENGQPFFQNSFQVVCMTVIQEGVSFAIGEWSQGISSVPGRMLFQAGAHYLSSGFFTMARGGDFNQGGLAGMASSIFSSIISQFACNIEIKAIQYLVVTTGGALAGGVVSEMTDGKFWDGFLNGAICAGLNHALHDIIGPPDDPPGDNKTLEAEKQTTDKDGLGTLATAWAIAVKEPTYYGEIVAALGTIGYLLLNPEQIDALTQKMEAEIARLQERLAGPPGFVYELRATTSGYYPNVRGGTTYLNAGEVWKIGETTKGDNRYSSNFLRTRGPGVEMHRVFYGNQRDIKIMEKYMIYDYFFNNGHLPPGNRIFR